MLQCHLHWDIKLFSAAVSLEDEACHLIKEARSKRIDIQEQAPTKTLIIQFHLHLSTSKQWLADFKILFISSTFSNCTNMAVAS